MILSIAKKILSELFVRVSGILLSILGTFLVLSILNSL